MTPGEIRNAAQENGNKLLTAYYALSPGLIVALVSAIGIMVWTLITSLSARMDAAAEKVSAYCSTVTSVKTELDGHKKSHEFIERRLDKVEDRTSTLEHEVYGNRRVQR